MVWTYEAQTMKKGEAELESYTTFSTADLGHTEGRTSAELQYELEIGMNDQFDVGIYQVFEQGPEEGLAYAAYKLRLRHWLAQPGKLPVDAVGYLEYKGVPDFSSHAIEMKLILGQASKQFRYALNPILEIESEEAGEWEAKLEYALGLSWTPMEMLSLGIEAKGSKDAHYVGPVFGHGLGDLWVAFGQVFRIDEEGGAGAGEKSSGGPPDSQLRLLIGINLRGH
jgi:hypothetical protein